MLNRKIIFGRALILLVIFGTVPATAQETVVVEFGSTVRYVGNTSIPSIGLTWTAEIFDDTGWSVGTYGVGYDDETGNEGAHFIIQSDVPQFSISAYTRATFEIDDLSSVQNVHLSVDYDDGVVAWINGHQIYCSPEMPTCSPSWNTLTAQHDSSDGAWPRYGSYIDASSAIPHMHNGTNVLAIGVWNATTDSGDLVVVPKLVVNKPSIDVTRGPYPQLVTTDSAVIRWKTSSATNSRVWYSTDPDNLNNSTEVAGSRTSHEVEITGLAAGTRYYYAVGDSGARFAHHRAKPLSLVELRQILSGSAADYYFQTHPPVGTVQPYRVWVVGDQGTADGNAGAVRQAYEDLEAGDHTDVWLTLGDNAYQNGTETEFQEALFESYPMLLRNTVIWPTFGNHDAYSASSSTQNGPYYTNFTLPDAGQAGGVSSGTEAYYSFDVGNIHFICLNSEDVNRNPTGPMLTWVENDISSTTQDWIVAYWHHSPYSKGSHDSDHPGDSGGRMRDMRQDALPILEDWGVDLVLTGHSHSYERSFLLDGHYGKSMTFGPQHQLNDGDGRVDSDGAYQKATAGPAAHEGTVYVVTGNAGLLVDIGALDHPAMYYSVRDYGSVVLDVEGHRMDVRLIDDDGVRRDYFTLVKNTAVAPTSDFSGSPVSGTAPLAVDFTDLSTTNAATWAWDLDGNGSTDDTDRSPSHVYTTPGNYAVSLTTTNDGGSNQETKTGYVCVSPESPGRVAGLAFAANRTTISWSALGSATYYYLIKGNLALLTSSGGDFSTSMLDCVENGDTDLTAEDTADPASGEGFFYLIAGTTCAGEPRSFESDGFGQVGLRDPAIGASPAACP